MILSHKADVGMPWLDPLTRSFVVHGDDTVVVVKDGQIVRTVAVENLIGSIAEPGWVVAASETELVVVNLSDPAHEVRIEIESEPGFRTIDVSSEVICTVHEEHLAIYSLQSGELILRFEHPEHDYGMPALGNGLVVYTASETELRVHDYLRDECVFAHDFAPRTLYDFVVDFAGETAFVTIAERERVRACIARFDTGEVCEPTT